MLKVVCPRSYGQWFNSTISFHSHNNPEKRTCHGKVMYLAPGHIASKQHICFIPKPTLSTTILSAALTLHPSHLTHLSHTWLLAPQEDGSLLFFFFWAIAHTLASPWNSGTDCSKGVTSNVTVAGAVSAPPSSHVQCCYPRLSAAAGTGC